MAVADLDADDPAPIPQRGRNGYRSYFSFESRPESREAVLDQFATWLRDRKDIDVDLDHNLVVEARHRTLTVAHHANRDGRRVRCRLVEDAGGVWRTDLTVSVPERAGRGWVNLSVACDAGRPAEPPDVFSRIVDVLDDPRDGALPLRSEAPVITRARVDDVVRWIVDADRHALMLVAGTGQELDLGAWVSRVNVWTRGMRGMAQAVVLDPGATVELAARLGASHEVPPWAIRTFQPDVEIGQPTDGRRHRILGARRLGGDSDSAIRRLLSGVARRHADHRADPPTLIKAARDLDRVTTAALLDQVFAPATEDAPAGEEVAAPASGTGSAARPAALGPPVVRDDGDLRRMRVTIADQARRLDEIAAVFGPDWTPETLVELAGAAERHRTLHDAYERDRAVLLRSRRELERSLTQVDDLRSEIESVRRELRAEEDERVFAELLREQAESESTWLRGELRGHQEWSAAVAPMPTDQEFEVPDSFEDLVDLFPEFAAHGVEFTGNETVARSLSELDGSGKFALVAWQSMMVLRSYVDARRNHEFEGGVDRYLRDTPAGYRRHPPGKHATGESEPTMARYGHLRVFPVPERVDPGGSASMPAHFRLGKAGMQSPRLHYLDTFSDTGVVYVGYLGPHLRTVRTN